MTVASLPTQGLAAVIHVPKDYPTIQGAIVEANSGDEIIVAPGIYNQAINFNGKAIYLHSSDGAPSTFIDGTGLKVSVVSCISGEGSKTVLEGFTITGGQSGTLLPFNSSFQSPYGYGMLNLDSSPTINSCIFVSNGTSSLDPAAGGGMANVGGSSPTINNCQFNKNSIGGGAGIWNGTIDQHPLTGSPVVSGCAFSGNSASSGGGIFSANYSLSVNQCSFVANAASTGGGAYESASTSSYTDCQFTNNTGQLDTLDISGGAMAINVSSTAINNCTFTGNQSGAGGALWIRANTGNQSSPTITNCTFNSNSAILPGNGIGGAIYADTCVPSIRRCTFNGNTSTHRGGAIGTSQAAPSIINCLITNNTSGTFGGGIWIANIPAFSGPVSPTVTNCTIVGNFVQTTGEGSGIQVGAEAYSPGPLKVTNCIVRGNSGGPNFKMRGLTVNLGWVSISYSNVEGPIDPFRLVQHDNIDADAMFVNPGSGDYHLQSGSPCIDSGTNCVVPADAMTDRDGNPRLRDGNADTVSWADMGCYEIQGPPGNLGLDPMPLAYWNFNSLDPQSPNIPSDGGQGMISTANWHGTADFGDGAQWNINALCTDPAGFSLRLTNQIGAGNGSYIQFSISMLGQSGLGLSFAMHRNANSFTNGVWSYSANGTSFTNVPGQDSYIAGSEGGGGGALLSANLAGVGALDNAPSVMLRYTLSGATSNDAYIELDNIQITTGNVPPPPPPPPSAIYDTTTMIENHTWNTVRASKIAAADCTNVDLLNDMDVADDFVLNGSYNITSVTGDFAQCTGSGNGNATFQGQGVLVEIFADANGHPVETPTISRFATIGDGLTVQAITLFPNTFDLRLKVDLAGWAPALSSGRWWLSMVPTLATAPSKSWQWIGDSNHMAGVVLHGRNGGLDHGNNLPGSYGFDDWTSFTVIGGGHADASMKVEGTLVAPLCPADINGNGTVNTADLLMVINSWGACPGACPPHCAADISPSGGDCVVNVSDLLAVINGWGPCGP